MQTKLTGGLFIIAGGVLLIYNSNLIVWKAFFAWSFILTILGIILLLVGYCNQNPTIVITSSIFTAISFFTWGQKYLGMWHWSILLSFIAIAIILLYFVTKQPLTGLSGVVILICSLFANPTIKNVAFLAPVSNVMHTYWPILFVILGVIFIFRK